MCLGMRMLKFIRWEMPEASRRLTLEVIEVLDLGCNLKIKTWTDKLHVKEKLFFSR